ncbi:hypothetical protein C8T65DRAFT_637824 [Cerioporus squamosus]|nr:hypothetical protein C8T65DRAFT_637824 [Cerioporus squamosus]
MSHASEKTRRTGRSPRNARSVDAARYAEPDAVAHRGPLPLPCRRGLSSRTHERKRRGHRASPPAHEAHEARADSNSSPRTWAREGEQRERKIASELKPSASAPEPPGARDGDAFPCPATRPAPDKPTTWERVGAGRHHAPVCSMQIADARATANTNTSSALTAVC